MRIHSKFQDYYDSCLGYGIDEQCHYKRETVEVEDKRNRRNIGEANEYDLVRDLEFPEFEMDNRAWRGDRNSRIECGISRGVLFCGKLYIYIRFTTTNYKDLYAYSVDDVEKIVKKYGSKEEIKNWNTKPNKKRYWRDMYKLFKSDVEKVFANQGEEKSEYVDIHHETEIPVLHILKSRYGSDNKLELNPVLKDIEFYKAVDAFQAFQELSMFISGVLGGQSPKMVQISDEIRIAKHGFDKMSFRKEKEK